MIKIDIVYTWVNGRDPTWREKKKNYLQSTEHVISKISASEARYRDNQELKYSLRSVYKYAPWINKIYLVTDNQVPEWFNSNNDWVKIVDHQDIFEDHSCLPTFNSMAIETKIHKIKDLSEHFMYFNDDVFLGRECRPSDFFTENMLPYIFTSKGFEFKPRWLLVKRSFQKREGSEHQASIENSRDLIYGKLGVYIKHKFRHGVKVFNKSSLIEAEDLFVEHLNQTSRSRFRTNEDFLMHSLYSFYVLAVNKGVAKFAPIIGANTRGVKKLVRKRSKYLFSYVNLSGTDVVQKLELIMENNPLMFCVNEQEGTPAENFKTANKFYEDCFPCKSPAEHNE